VTTSWPAVVEEVFRIQGRGTVVVFDDTLPLNWGQNVQLQTSTATTKGHVELLLLRDPRRERAAVVLAHDDSTQVQRGDSVEIHLL